MQNNQPNDIYVYQEQQEIIQEEEPHREMLQEEREEINQNAGFNSQPSRAADLHYEIEEMISPNFHSTPHHEKPLSIHPISANPAKSSNPSTSNFIFQQQNAYSFRQNEPKKQTNKQVQFANQLEIISDFHSQTSKSGEAEEMSKFRDHQQKAKRTKIRRYSKQINEESSEKNQNKLTKMQNIYDSQKLVRNILTPNDEEENNITQDNFKYTGDSVDANLINNTVKRRRRPQLSSLQPEKPGQIYIDSSNILENESSIIGLNKKEEDLSLPNISSFTHMANNEDEPINFAEKSIDQNKLLKCQLKREKQCCLSFCYPQYSFYFRKRKFILNARKEFGHICSYYNITTSEKEFTQDNDHFRGYLSANFIGSCFNLYQLVNNIYELVCTITYDYEFNCSPSARKMEIYLKSEDCTTSSLAGFTEMKDANLKELYLGQNSKKKITKLINKQPEWQESHDCYHLNFKGKCKFPSVKNMIIVNPQEPQRDILLFCKVDQHLFHTQIAYPLSPFIAMGIILSSFDFKLCCQ